MQVQKQVTSQRAPLFDGSKQDYHAGGALHPERKLAVTPQGVISAKFDSFGDVCQWAEQLVSQFHLIETQSHFSGSGTYFLLSQIYAFTLAMQKQGKVERIHSSCVAKLAGVQVQPRNDFACICLLLTLTAPETFDRHKRFRLSAVLHSAQKHGVRPDSLVAWIRRNGGIDKARSV